jgi:hypothetical protein
MLDEYLKKAEKSRATRPLKIDSRLREVSRYVHLLNDGIGKLNASLIIARTKGKGSKCARGIRAWAKEYLANGTLGISRRGNHSKTVSPILDEDFKLRLSEYCRAHKQNFTLHQFKEFVEKVALPSFGDPGKSITEETARLWLKKLGYRYTSHRKDLYYDGHERDDVVQYRNNVFLPRMAHYESLMRHYTGDDMTTEILPTLPNSERERVFITHDESTFHANDAETHYWAQEGEYRLRKKGLGRARHVSEFICEAIGRLRLNPTNRTHNASLQENQRIPEEACVMIDIGKNHDGYWTAKDVAIQVFITLSLP